MANQAYFLGLDSSTQSLSATLIGAENSAVISEVGINFDECFGKTYGTANGVIHGANEGEVFSNPLMWLDALELVFRELQAKGLPLDKIASIAGSGQQHGSVYLNAQAERVLAGLNATQSLSEQCRPIFSRELSPIWMDSSTEAECAEMEQAVGGKEAMIALTGSAAFRRFSGPQIRKFYKTEPAGYAATQHIALVSSFIASILSGKLVSIDPGDGAGMNLMDITAKQWSAQALEACAPGLDGKLLPIRPSDTVAGTIAPYFYERYGFSPDCRIALFSGDNPCSMIGTGLVSPGMAGISLGTSDTMFTCMRELHTSAEGEGVVFGSPTGDYMSLICMSNGSLAREKIKDQFAMDWDQFSAALGNTPAGNNGAFMLPYFEQEIYPPLKGVQRFNLAEDDGPANVRAVVEAQAMAMKIHGEWMQTKADSICMTGGASVNDAILQIFADVHQAEVYRFETPNSASLGAALRAYHAHSKMNNPAISWKEICGPFTQPVAGSEIKPNPDNAEVYAELITQYREAVSEALKN